MSQGLTEPTWAPWPMRALLAVLAALVALSTLPANSTTPLLHAAAQETESGGEEVIVVLEPGEDPAAVAQELGVEPTHVYHEVFNGFAATLPAAAVEAANASGAVRRISQDGRVQAEDQAITAGVLRVGTPWIDGSQNLNLASPIDADIAILDTGIARRSDLNVAGGKSCVDKNKKHKKKKGKKNGKNEGKAEGKKNKQGKSESKAQAEKKGKKGKKKKNRKSKGKPWEDDNGHGTHVAGIAAAYDNFEDIAGVAPGARLWAVKVLDNSGGGSFSDVICGLDWVYANSQTIDVVNLSLSGPGSDGPCASSALHQAVCNVVSTGIPVAVAAGNQGTDASSRVPASYDEVITVSGMADSDGAPGHLGPPTCFGNDDDTFLPFSNFGPDVDIAAPGDCILSLWFKGGLRQFSGTSEASPHVAGAAANFIARFVAANGFRPSADQVKTWLLTVASKPQNSSFGFTGDPDGGLEPMLWLQEALGG